MNATLSIDSINSWADDLAGPVALHLRHQLQPVEGHDGVVFPPTYAGARQGDKSQYNIDHLSDGTKVAAIDSVGSQANRIEPIFKSRPYAELVPQITVTYNDGKSTTIFDVGHRLGDALIRSSGSDDDGFDLRLEARKAFLALQERADASLIARLAPTSLVFGAWDSRDTQAKLPRIVQSVIRAWDVDELRRSAQYTPALDYAEMQVFSDDEKQKAEGNPKSPLAQRGFVDNPSTGDPGGVRAHGGITRDVTVNLVALRRLAAMPEQAATSELAGPHGRLLRRYILGLSLVAASAPMEPFLRQGCLLVPDPETVGGWEVVARTGERTAVNLTPDAALAYARTAASDFGVGPNHTVSFEASRAKQDLKRADKKATSES